MRIAPPFDYYEWNWFDTDLLEFDDLAFYEVEVTFLLVVSVNNNLDLAWNIVSIILLLFNDDPLMLFIW